MVNLVHKPFNLGPRRLQTRLPLGGPSTLLDDLVAYWALEEESGVRVDATERENDLTAINNPGNAAGKVGDAADFVAGNAQYLTINSNEDVEQSESFTIALWVNLSSNFALTSFVAKWNAPANQRSFHISLQRAGVDRIRFVLSGDGTSGTITVVDADDLGLPTTDVWYLVIAKFDMVAETISIKANNGALNTAVHTHGAFAGTEPFRVGSLTGSTAFMDGLIDEVGIWKRVLTLKEDVALWNNGNGITYPFIGAST